MTIQLIRQEDIDRLKWDSCVHYAINGNVYGYAWFLNNVAKTWDALVEGEYESVFPLVWRENFLGVKELYQPPLIRELGVYSVHVLSKARIRSFLNAIPEEYKLINISLNEQNAPLLNEQFEWQERSNHQLLLDEPYEKIEAHYSDRLKNAIAQAENAGLKVTSNLKPEAIAEFYRQHTTDRRELTRTFHALHRIMYNVLHRGKGFASGVLDGKGELCAVNFYIYSHNKLVSLIPVVSPKGRQAFALPFMTDVLLRTNSGRPLILDFNRGEEDEWAKEFGTTVNDFYHIRRDKRTLGLF